MDEVAITSQLTSYDKFLHTLSQVDNRHNWPQNRYYAAVVVPPKEPDTKEKWVAVSPVAQYPGQIGTATGRAVVEGAQWDIFADVKQPDPERNAICGGGGENGCCFWLCYWYADELPRCIALAVIFAVILSIFTTPLVLICFVPMIRRMVKVNRVEHTPDKLHSIA